MSSTNVATYNGAAELAAAANRQEGSSSSQATGQGTPSDDRPIQSSDVVMTSNAASTTEAEFRQKAEFPRSFSMLDSPACNPNFQDAEVRKIGFVKQKDAKPKDALNIVSKVTANMLFEKDSADEISPLQTLRNKVTRWVLSLPVQAFVMAVILLDCVMTICAIADVSFVEGVVQTVIEWAVLTVMAADVGLRLFGISWAFFRSPLNIFELFLVPLALIEIVALNEIDIPLPLLRMLRPTFRAIRIARVLIRTLSRGEEYKMALKRRASGSRNRFQQGGFDLDLSYITPQIIAMAEPVVGREALYKNPVPEVAQMLNEYHPNKYLLINLTETRYFSLEPFFARYVQFPISRNSVPTLRDMMSFCEEVNAYLAMDKNNVICTYSTNGTGRCGLMISALLLYNGTFQSVPAVLSYFEGRRTDPTSPVEHGNSVDTCSQFRFLEYFLSCVSDHDALNLNDPRKVTLRRMRITGLPENMVASVHLCCFQHQRGGHQQPEGGVFIKAANEEEVLDLEEDDAGDQEQEAEGLEQLEQQEEETDKHIEQELTEIEEGEDAGVSMQDGIQIFDSRNDVRIRAVRGESLSNMTTVYTEKAKDKATCTPVLWECQDGSVELEGEIRMQVHCEVRRMKFDVGQDEDHRKRPHLPFHRQQKSSSDDHDSRVQMVLSFWLHTSFLEPKEESLPHSASKASINSKSPTKNADGDPTSPGRGSPRRSGAAQQVATKYQATLLRFDMDRGAGAPSLHSYGTSFEVFMEFDFDDVHYKMSKGLSEDWAGKSKIAGTLFGGMHLTASDLEISSRYSLGWLNWAVQRIWPYAEAAVGNLLKETIEPEIQKALPGPMKGLKFKDFRLGNKAPHLGPIAAYTRDQEGYEIDLDIGVNWIAENVSVGIELKGVALGIEEIQLKGVLSLKLKPILDELPIVAGIQIFFMDPPAIDLKFSGQLEIINTHMIHQAVISAVNTVLGQFLVLPNLLVINWEFETFEKEDAIVRLEDVLPAGVLRICITEARNLPKVDSMTGTADPYVIVRLGVEQHQTTVVPNTLDPYWNESFDFQFYNVRQCISVRIYDKDFVTSDDLVGKLEGIRIPDLLAAGGQGLWLEIQPEGGPASSQESSAQIHLSAQMFDLVSEAHLLVSYQAMRPSGPESEDIHGHTCMPQVLCAPDRFTGCMPQPHHSVPNPDPLVEKIEDQESTVRKTGMSCTKVAMIICHVLTGRVPAQAAKPEQISLKLQLGHSEATQQCNARPEANFSLSEQMQKVVEALSKRGYTHQEIAAVIEEEPWLVERVIDGRMGFNLEMPRRLCLLVSGEELLKPNLTLWIQISGKDVAHTDIEMDKILSDPDMSFRNTLALPIGSENVELDVELLVFAMVDAPRENVETITRNVAFVSPVEDSPREEHEKEKKKKKAAKAASVDSQLGETPKGSEDAAKEKDEGPTESGAPAGVASQTNTKSKKYPASLEFLSNAQCSPDFSDSKMRQIGYVRKNKKVTSDEEDTGLGATWTQVSESLHEESSPTEGFDKGAIRQGIGHFIESIPVQAVVILVIFVDCILTIRQLAGGEPLEVADIIDWVVFAVMLLDCVCRIISGGCAFFKSGMNIFETLLIPLTLAEMLVLRHMDIPVPVLRMIRPVFRLVRILRIVARALSRGKEYRKALRRKVAGSRKRLTEDGFDLDLAYITSQIISMSLPAVGYEILFRNPLPEVARLLNEKHPNRYLLVNLTEERKFSLEPFFNRYVDFPIPQDGVPTLKDLWEFCEDISNFLAMNRTHVVCLYSKHGSGRVALVCSSLLLYLRHVREANSALAFFERIRTDELRMHEQGTASVDSASQLRLLEYFAVCCHRDGGSAVNPPRKIKLKKITINGLPHLAGQDAVIKCFGRSSSSSWRAKQLEKQSSKSSSNTLSVETLKLQDDLVIDALRESKAGACGASENSGAHLFETDMQFVSSKKDPSNVKPLEFEIQTGQGELQGDLCFEIHCKQPQLGHAQVHKRMQQLRNVRKRKDRHEPQVGDDRMVFCFWLHSSFVPEKTSRHFAKSSKSKEEGLDVKIKRVDALLHRFDIDRGKYGPLRRSYGCSFEARLEFEYNVDDEQMVVGTKKSTVSTGSAQASPQASPRDEDKPVAGIVAGNTPGLNTHATSLAANVERSSPYSLGWLDWCVDRLWPFAEAAIVRLLKETVEPALKEILPGPLKKTEFPVFSLGSAHPRLGPVVATARDHEGFEVQLNIGVSYEGDANIVLDTGIAKLGISEIKINGDLSVKLKPIIPEIPIVAGVQIFFLNPPDLDISFTGQLEIANASVVREAVLSAIQQALLGILVLPNLLVIDYSFDTLASEEAIVRFEDVLPQAVLVINVIEAKRLPANDFGLFRTPASDPYAVVELGNQKRTTKVKKKTVTPRWDESFSYLLHSVNQKVQVQVYDRDTMSRDDFLCYTTGLKAADIMTAGAEGKWVDMISPDSGGEVDALNGPQVLLSGQVYKLNADGNVPFPRPEAQHPAQLKTSFTHSASSIHPHKEAHKGGTPKKTEEHHTRKVNAKDNQNIALLVFRLVQGRVPEEIADPETVTLEIIVGGATDNRACNHKLPPASCLNEKAKRTVHKLAQRGIKHDVIAEMLDENAELIRRLTTSSLGYNIELFQRPTLLLTTWDLFGSTGHHANQLTLNISAKRRDTRHVFGSTQKVATCQVPLEPLIHSTERCMKKEVQMKVFGCPDHVSLDIELKIFTLEPGGDDLVSRLVKSSDHGKKS